MGGSGGGGGGGGGAPEVVGGVGEEIGLTIVVLVGCRVVVVGKGGGGEAGGKWVFAGVEGEAGELAGGGKEAAAIAFGDDDAVEEGD